MSTPRKRSRTKPRTNSHRHYVTFPLTHKLSEMKYDEAPKTHPLKIDYEIETKELNFLHILNASITYEIYPKIYRWNL